MYNLLILFFLFSFALVCLVKNKMFNSYISFILFFFISLLFGFRYGVGIDYFQYEFNFNTQTSSEIRSEFLYSYLNILFKYFFNDFYYLTLFYCFFINFTVYFFIRKIFNNSYFLIISSGLFFTNFMLFSLNGMRQALAISFILISFYIVKNFFSKVIFFFLGVFFHFSLLLFPIFYYLNSYFCKSKNIVLIYLLFLNISIYITFSSSSRFLEYVRYIINYIPYYDKYNDSSILDVMDRSGGYGVYLKFLISLFVSIINYFKWYSIPYNIRVIYCLYMIGVIFNILSISNFMLSRVGVIFYIFEVIAIPYSLLLITNKSFRSLMYVLILIYIFSLLYVQFYQVDLSSPLYYRSIFSE